MENGEARWWQPISHFLGHAVVGAVLFLIVACFAVGLAFAVKYLTSLGVPEFTIWVLTLLEHIILVGDTILYVVYMYVAGTRFFREVAQ